MLAKGVMSVASKAIGNNSKAMNALNEAISMSGQFQPNMSGAIQIAQKFGFSAQQLANLRAMALNNTALMNGVESVIPGATNTLVNMSKELESKLSSTQNQAGGSPAIGTPSTPNSQDDVSQRLSRIRF